jgi:phospholipase/lecithinase/hemolysin
MLAGQESPAAAVSAVTAAGTQLAGYIVKDILNKGANHVLIMNLQDLSLTPVALSEPASTQTFIRQLAVSYNTALQAGLASTSASKVLQVDVFSFREAEAANPAKYGFTNVTTPACNLSYAANPLSSSLICTTANLEPGSVLNYQFADLGHPTPFGHSVLAQEVLAQMTAAGSYQAN